MKGKIYIVATPIGNLEDITLRALRILKEADIIVCEDTRVTQKLLSKFEIKKRLFSIHQHSTQANMERVLEFLEEGDDVVYVSDAGTPGVNDPGNALVDYLYKHGIEIIPIPGASALTTIISIAGFPMERFEYLGFVPHKKGRKTFFEKVAKLDEAVIFFESTHRILKALDSLQEVLDSDRKLCIGRELTKLHETVYRGNIEEVKEQLIASSTKGEFVIVIAPKKFS